jgi:hypothetical protein
VQTKLQTELGLIKERFSTSIKTVEELYTRDAEFKSLCADYFLCDQTIRKMEHEMEEMESILREYKDALNDLEKEISSWVPRH